MVKIKQQSISFVENCPDLKGDGEKRVFLNILNSLNNNKFNIYAAFPNIVNGELAKEIPDYAVKLLYDTKSPGINVDRIYEYLRFIIFIPIIFVRWFYLLNKYKIDVIYLHFIISGLHFSMLKPFFRFKLIYHEHNMASQRPSGLLWRKLFSYVVNSADFTIAISTDVRDSLIKYGTDKDKVKVLYNGREIRELHNSTGLLVDEIDHIQLAKAIGSSALDEKAKKRMGEKGRLLLESKFSSEKQSDRIEQEIFNL